MVVGFVRTRDQRSVDRRHLAAFVGFSAAVVALIAGISGAAATAVWFGPAYFHPVRQGFLAVFSVVALVSTGIAFIAALFSRGISRIALVIFGPLMCLIYLL